MGRRNDSPKTIYAIYCKPTRRTYIGCCTCFEVRIRAHFLQLQRGEKLCTKSPGVRAKTDWQTDYDEHGENAFDVYVLETEVSADEAKDKEDAYILKYRADEPEHGYNLRPGRRYSVNIKPGAPPIPTDEPTI